MITNEKRRELAKEIHANAIEKGFWAGNLSSQHYLMLAITELSEAVEADRYGMRANKECFERQISERDLYEVAFNCSIKDTVEDELADAYIRLLDVAEGKNINIISSAISSFDIVEQIKSQDFTETIFVAVAGLIERFEDNDISDILTYLEIIAEVYEIDLLWHIEAKMKYNKLRPVLHGKKY